MKQRLEELEKIKEDIKYVIDFRDIVFNNRLKNWQESEDGESFYNMTYELHESILHLNLAIENINRFIKQQ